MYKIWGVFGTEKENTFVVKILLGKHKASND